MFILSVSYYFFLCIRVFLGLFLIIYTSLKYLHLCFYVVHSVCHCVFLCFSYFFLFWQVSLCTTCMTLCLYSLGISVCFSVYLSVFLCISVFLRTLAFLSLCIYSLCICTFMAALELSGTPSLYFPVSRPQANGDQVMAPTPERPADFMLNNLTRQVYI